MYDKNICGKEIIILVTLSNSKNPDEMLHNVAFIILRSSWLAKTKFPSQKDIHVQAYKKMITCDPPHYMQWTVQSILFQTRRKDPFGTHCTV